MIVLSLVCQFLFLMVIVVAIEFGTDPLQKNEGRGLEWGVGIGIGLLIIFNAVTFYEYFKLGRAAGVYTHSGQTLPTLDNGAVLAFFMIPRGIDRIVTGSERIMSTGYPRNEGSEKG